MMIFQKDSLHPILASVNEENKIEAVDKAPVGICSKIKAANKVAVQTNDPNTGFMFAALTECEEGAAVELFKFMPNFKP
jgi:hypothetical protein